MRKNFVKGMTALCMCAAFASCSQDVNFAPADEFEVAKNEYKANFVKRYGAIDPNETWDFATMEPTISLGASISAARTRANNTEATITKGNMEIEGDVVSWVTTNLKAGSNNFVKGSPFYMLVPENSFTIVPVFQGQAGYYWQLYLSVGEGDSRKDYQIWEKYDIQYKKTEKSGWITPDNNGMKTVYGVKAPTLTISNLPVGQKMSFYLRVWTSTDKFKAWSKNKTSTKVEQPKILSSLDYQMLALEGISRPAAVPEDNGITFIGCEDKAIVGNSDRDYEDLVFMMYGKPEPPVKHTDEVTVSTTKRYMIEDLGATNDFDFNDVVVDVSEVFQRRNYYNVTAEGGFEFDHYEDLEGTRHQEAIVRAMGGTINFTLKIGDTTWSKSDSEYDVKEMLNTGWKNTEINENAELAKFTVTGWDPSKNNISISVEGRGNNEGYKTITFPKKGEVPMIIATDAKPLTPWQKEKVSIPSDWYTED